MITCFMLSTLIAILPALIEGESKKKFTELTEATLKKYLYIKYPLI